MQALRHSAARLAAAGLGAALLAGSAAAQPPVDEIVAAVQARYGAVRDLAADFEHRASGGVLTTTDVERGAVRIKRPGKWRFDYTDPEPKRFVSDGATVYAHFPLDRQVVVSEAPAAGASNPAAFLAGRGDLVRDYAAAWADAAEAPPNTWVLRLTPHRGDAEYEALELAVDRDTLDIRQLSSIDFLGAESTYRFSNLRTNRGLPDDLFDFEIPPETDVLRDDGTLRP